MATSKTIKDLYNILPIINKLGSAHVWFDFDKDADTMYICLYKPQNATDTDITRDGILLRYRAKELVGITITEYSKRFKIDS